MKKLLLAIFVFMQSSISPAPPLDDYSTFVTANPFTSKRGQWSQLLARGSGTTDFYVLEVDPSNGALPVSIVSGSLVLGYDTNYGAVGADTLRTAAQIGNSAGAAAFGAGNYSAQTLRTVIATDQPAINVNFTPALTDYGAATNAQRVASMLGVGTTAVSNSNPVPISDAGGTITVDGTVAATQSGTWNIGTVTSLTNALPAGTNIIGNVRIDQTTPGTTNGVQITAAIPAGANTIGAVTGSGTFTTNQTTAAVTWQTEGSLAFGSLTTSFQTVFTTGGSLVWLGLRNNTDGTIIVSVDGGSTSAFTLDPGDAISLDLKPQGKSIAGAVAIQAKYSGSAPSLGTFRVNGYY